MFKLKTKKMSFKNIFCLAISTLAIVSCSKEAENSIKVKDLAGKMNNTIIVNATVDAIPVEDFVPKDESFRAVKLEGKVIGEGKNGDPIKYLPFLLKLDHTINGSVFWAVAGSGGSVETLNGYKANPTQDDMYRNTGGTYTIKEANGKQSIRLYYHWNDNNKRFMNGSYGFMALNGVPNGRAVDYNKPNFILDKGIEGLQQVLADGVSKRDLPLMTNAIKITRTDANGLQANAGANNAEIKGHIKPRGCVLAFNIKNITSHKVRVKSIEVVNTSNHPSPLHFAGSFSYQDIAANAGVKTTYTGDSYKLPFNGVPVPTSGKSFPLYDKDGVAGLDITANDGITDGRFFLWGFPVAVAQGATAQPLVIKLKYQFYSADGYINNNSEDFSKALSIHAPSRSVGNNANGWEDGKVFRATLRLEKRSTDDPDAVIEYIQTATAANLDPYDPVNLGETESVENF